MKRALMLRDTLDINEETRRLKRLMVEKEKNTEMEITDEDTPSLMLDCNMEEETSEEIKHPSKNEVPPTPVYDPTNFPSWLRVDFGKLDPLVKEGNIIDLGALRRAQERNQIDLAIMNYIRLKLSVGNQK